MHRKALIDNASLTAVQRLLGKIQVKNLYNVNGDVAAFESLLQAILFFDEVCCIDDYKEDFRASRKREFGHITFISKKDLNYAELLQAAKQQADDIGFRVASSEIDTEEFRKFFELLRTQLVFNWQIRSSVFYLTTDLLIDRSDISAEKYGTLRAMITSQFWGEGGESDQLPEVEVTDRSGHRVKDGFTSGGRDYVFSEELKKFAAALNWLALKSAFYVFAAEENGMEIVLHPIRHAFVANQVQKLYRLSPSAYSVLTSILRDGITGTVREITHATDPILSEMNLPMWSAYFATRTKDPTEFLTESQHLREEGLFVEARSRFNELDDLNEMQHLPNYVKEVNKLKYDLSRVSERLLARYGVSTPQGIAVAPIANLLLRPTTGLALPDLGRTIRTPRSLVGITDRRGFRGLFRSVVSDLVSIERLGSLHDVITSRVHRQEDATHFGPKAETSEWLGKNSSWKEWL